MNNCGTFLLGMAAGALALAITSVIVVGWDDKMSIGSVTRQDDDDDDDTIESAS